jgi:signal transduction histidine kinase
MKIFNYIIDSSGKVILNNFPTELQYLLKNNIEKTEKVEIQYDNKKIKAKIGKQTSSKGSIITLTIDEKYVNSSRLFADLSSMSLLLLDNIISHRNNISLNQNEYVQELIHNLTSLNTYNVQELQLLIPQNVLSQNINKQKEVIKKIVNEKPNVTTETLLKLIKYNYAMKVEFSVFEKTIMQNPNVQKIEYSVREIILSVLQIFIEDFDDKKILVSIDYNEKRIHIDYEILFVSLFYIFENAVKYCCSHTDFKIIFKEEQNKYIVVFEMLSLRIEDYEISKLCDKKFRAKSAIELTSEGKGIGMNRILKTLKLNNGELEILPRITSKSKTKNNLQYEHNQFKIIFDMNRII